MTIDTARLRALAEKATPGPWGEEDHSNSIIVQGTEGYSADGSARAVAETVYTSDDRQFIAAADPQTVLALLDEIDLLRGETEWEYGRRRRSDGVTAPLAGTPSPQWWSESQDEWEHVKRPRGPWEPVQEGETND